MIDEKLLRIPSLYYDHGWPFLEPVFPPHVVENRKSVLQNPPPREFALVELFWLRLEGSQVSICQPELSFGMAQMTQTLQIMLADPGGIIPEPTGFFPACQVKVSSL